MLRVLGQALFGLIVGLLARAILPGEQHMGLIVTMILGIAGAWLGGLIGRIAGISEEGRNPGFLMALLGAVILVLIYSLISKSTTATLLGPQIPTKGHNPAQALRGLPDMPSIPVKAALQAQ